MWICPECNRWDGLTVTVVSSANLYQEQNGDNFETEVQGDHEWDQGSTMSCDNCGHVGSALQFECNRPLQPQHPDGPMPSHNRRHTDD